MNESFKQHMAQITNPSKPTLKQINDSFFEASERYQESLKSSKIKKNSKGQSENGTPSKAASSYAAKVYYQKDKAKFHPCVLCSTADQEANHPIYKCESFNDACSKVDKLISLKGCSKCSNLNHNSENCTFRFHSRCKFCKAWHFHFLCLKNAEADKVIKEDDSKSCKNVNKKGESSAHLTVSEVLKSLDAEALILPTFSYKINGRYIRVLKDGGCQTNFITEDFARSLDLKVLDKKVKVKINGINISLSYVSKIVQFDMSIGEDLRTLQVFCIPSLNINLQLPGLSGVVRGFQEKGYVLADKFLTDTSNCIDNVDLILGTESTYCMPDHDIVFGAEGKSVYSETPHGIILKGDIGTLLKDLHFLPSLYKM